MLERVCLGYDDALARAEASLRIKGDGDFFRKQTWLTPK